jgi:phosphoglycerate kinase
MQFLSASTFSNKTVFLRLDLNAPMSGEVILDTKRIDEVLPTIRHIIDQKNKLIICSHLGRPKSKDLSLKPVFNYLKSILKEIKFHFVKDLHDQYESTIKNSSNQEIIFLENIRYYQEEEKNNTEFKKLLSNGIDIYCNDAFSCSHRAHSSIMLAELFSPENKFCGLLFEKEISNLNKILHKENGTTTAIIGGSKISTKMPIIKQLINKVDNLIIVGAMANTISKHQGFNLGKSLVEDGFNNACSEILSQEKCKIFFPESVVVTDNIKNPTYIKTKNLSEISDQDIVVDTGLESVLEFVKIASNSNCVLWNGPLGITEISPFESGTIKLGMELINLTQKYNIESIVGGGDTISAIKNLDLNGFSYVSTSGGAFLEFIESNGKLPGIKALKHP